MPTVNLSLRQTFEEALKRAKTQEAREWLKARIDEIRRQEGRK